MSLSPRNLEQPLLPLRHQPHRPRPLLHSQLQPLLLRLLQGRKLSQPHPLQPRQSRSLHSKKHQFLLEPQASNRLNSAISCRIVLWMNKTPLRANDLINT